MNLSGLVAVSGRAGLFKVIGQSKAGFILQLLEDTNSRIVVNTNARLAALDETTVYGIDKDISLKQILVKMQETASSVPVPDTKADPKTQRQYFSVIVPDHDDERVYASDIKKIISWYKMLEPLSVFTEADPKEVNEKEEKNTSLHVEEPELGKESKSKEAKTDHNKGSELESIKGSKSKDAEPDHNKGSELESIKESKSNDAKPDINRESKSEAQPDLVKIPKQKANVIKDKKQGMIGDQKPIGDAKKKNP